VNVLKADGVTEGLRLIKTALKNLNESTNGAFTICIDGDVSTGKTTLAALLRREMSNTENFAFLSIGIDGIIADLREEGLTPLFAFLEVPFMLSERIRSDGRIINIIEGTQSAYYVSQAGFKPDIVIFINTSKTRQLLRHLRRYGPFAFRYLLEDYEKSAVPAGTRYVIEIYNPAGLPILNRFFVSTLFSSSPVSVILPDFFDSSIYSKASQYIRYSKKYFYQRYGRKKDLCYIRNFDSRPTERGYHEFSPLESFIVINEVIAKVNKPFKILDLGSGNGFLGVGLAFIFTPAAKVSFIEYDRQLSEEARTRIRWFLGHGLIEQEQISSIVRGDFFDYDFRPYDIFYFYDLGLAAQNPQKLEKKILKELDKKSYFIVYRPVYNFNALKEATNYLNVKDKEGELKAIIFGAEISKANDFSSSTIVPTYTYKGRLKLFDSWFVRKYPYAEGNFADLGIGMMVNEDGLVVPQTTLEFAKQFPNLKVYGIDSIIPAVSVRIKDYWGMFSEQGKLMAVMEESRETSGGYILEETAVDARIKSRFIQLHDNALKENPDMFSKRMEFSASQEVIFRPYEIAAAEENIENIEFIESSFKDLKEIFKNTRFNYGRVFNINLHYPFEEALRNLKDIAGVFEEGGVVIEGQTIGKQNELLFAEYELIKGKIVPEELWVFKKYSGLFSHSKTNADRFIPTIFRLGEYKKFFTILKNAYLYLTPKGFTPGSKEFNRELNIQLKQYYEILELPAISSMLGLSVPQKSFAIDCKSSSPISGIIFEKFSDTLVSSSSLQSWYQAYKYKDLSNPQKIINHKDLPGRFSQIAQMGHISVNGSLPWSGELEGQLWLGDKKIGTFLKYRSAKYKLEIIDGFPVTIYFDRDKTRKDFLPIADPVSLQIIEFYFSRINKEDLDSYREVEIVTRLNNSGALSIIGGKPWANGEKTKRQRPWAKFRNYPGELVVATVRDGLVFRCRSLESELNEPFALVWDQRQQRYLASFWGKIQKEDFNLLDSRHQIHNYSLSKDGSLLLGGQEWFNFGRTYGYKKAFITEIINSAGRTFVVSAQLRQQDQVLTQRRLLLVYELLTDSPAELFLKGDLVAVFERFSRDKINRQAGRKVKNYIVSTVSLGAGGFLDLDGFGGSFRHYPGAKTEVMFLDGSKAMVKFIEDAKGRPILDREGNSLVIDIRKDIRGQVFSKSGRSNKLRLEKLAGKAREAKQLLSRENYQGARQLLMGMLHARRKRENQVKGEEELFAAIDFYLAYIELMESLKYLLDRREHQDLAAREIIKKGQVIEKSFQRSDYLKANDDLADFANEVKILSLHKHTKKLADCLNYYQIVNDRENAVCAPAQDILGYHKRNNVFIKKGSLKNGVIKIGSRRFDLNRHIDAGQRNAPYKAELEDDLPLRVKIEGEEEKTIEFKRVIDNRSGRLVDVFLSKISRDKLVAYEDVSVPVKLDSEGKLWLAGGRPNVDGSLPSKNKAWGSWSNHPGERGFAVIKKGLVHRFISVDSNLDDELSLVWDDKERKYLTSFKSLNSAEFHSLSDSAQIHNHKLAAKGEAYFATYSCRTRSAAIMFGSDFAYRRAKLFISNPSGKKAFITGGEVIDAKGKIIRKELSLAYRRQIASLPMGEMPAGEEETDEFWQVLSLENTFQFMQKELLACLDNHIIRNVYFSEAGILNFTEYIGASGKLKGAKIEIAVSGGQARFIRVVEDRFGRPVLDKEKKTLVIDLNKGLVNQLKEKTYLTESNQGEALTRLRDELSQLIDAPEQIIDKLAKVITGYGFNSKWKTRLTGIYRKYGILDQSAGLTHVSAQRVLAQMDFDFSQLSPLVTLHQVRDILGIHLGVEFPRRIKLSAQENLSNLFNPKTKNSSRRKYLSFESAKKALMARPQQERTAKSLNRRKDQGGDFTLLYACRKFGIELPREINSREEQLSGYDRFKQELIRRNMSEYGSQELFALWEDAQAGDKEARLQLIEYFTPLVVNIAEGNGNSVWINTTGNVYGQRQFYLDDDIGRGNIALIEALDQWSPQREESLFDYTAAKIKEAIVSGRKQAFAEKYRLKSIDQPWGNKGGNSPSAKGQMPTNQRTLGDSLGSDQTASIERFVLMQEVLSSIQNEDYSFLGSTEVSLDANMIVSQREKLSLKESLKKYFLKQGISKAISSRFGVWIIASMGRVGLARKKSSDLNLMVVTDTDNGQLKESAIALRNLIGSGKVSETRKDYYTVTLEKDSDALTGLQMALDAPEFMSLLNSHNIGGNGKLASLELFTVEGMLNGNNSHLERARFHITEDIYQMGANGILVLESEEGFSGYIQESLKEKLTTETMDYEYFMNEYILQFFAKQVIKLQNEQKSLNPAKKLFDERIQITERPEGVCICLLDALPEDVSVYRPFISSIAARYKDETIYVDDPLIMGEALERKAAIIEGQTDDLAEILREEKDGCLPSLSQAMASSSILQSPFYFYQSAKKDLSAKGQKVEDIRYHNGQSRHGRLTRHLYENGNSRGDVKKVISILERFSSQGVILSIGCGSASLEKEIVEKNDKGVIAIDIYGKHFVDDESIFSLRNLAVVCSSMDIFEVLGQGTLNHVLMVNAYPTMLVQLLSKLMQVRVLDRFKGQAACIVKPFFNADIEILTANNFKNIGKKLWQVDFNDAAYFDYCQLEDIYIKVGFSSKNKSSSACKQNDFFKQDFLALTDREIDSDFSLKALYHNPDTKVINMERADVTAFEDSISFFAVEKDTDQIKSRLKKQEKTISKVSSFKPRVKIILKIISDVLNNKYKYVPKYPMICSGATMICREVFMSLGYQVQTLWTKDIHYFLRVYLNRDKYKSWGVTIDLTSFQFGQEGISKLNLDIETIVLKIKENHQIFKDELEDIITQYNKIPIKKLTLADRDSLITAFLKLYFLMGKTNFSGYKQWIYRAVWKASALQHKNQRMLWQNSLRKMYRAALIRINPYMCIRDYVKRNNRDNSLVIGKNSYDLEKIEKIIIAGIGSFAFLISKAFLEICRDKIGEGLIITDQKQGLPNRIGKINIISVDKGKIGRKNIEAAHKIKEIVSSAESKDLVIMIDSDETARLMVFPETVVSLRDYIDTINLLAGSVDNISEINKVVQSIDKLKGDKMRKLAREAGHFITVALAGIFVFEDKPFIVEDGVAAESRYTFRDAYDVLNKYYLWEKIPASIRFYIKRGLEGKLKINSAGYDNTIVKVSSRYLVSRNNYLACKSVAKKAWKLGYRPKLMQRRLNEEVGVAARIIFEEIKKHLSSPFPVALIWGGDLRLRDDIKNLVKDIPAIHLVLDIARKLSQEEIKNVKFLAADTEKGFNDSNVSGAMADYKLIKKARACQVDSNGCLIDFRNVSFLEGLGYEVNLDVEAIGISDIMVALIIPCFGKDSNIFNILDERIAEGTGDSDTDWYIKILNSGFSSSSAIGSQRRVVGRELDLYKRLEKIVDSEIYYLGLSEKSSDQEIIYKIGRKISSKEFIMKTVFELSLALIEKDDRYQLIEEANFFQCRYELIKSSKLFFLIGCPFSALSVFLILKGSELKPVAVTNADEFHIFSGAEGKRGILLLDFTDSYSKRMRENFTYLEQGKINNLGLTVYRNQAAFSTILAYAYQNIAAMYQERENQKETDKYLEKSINYRKLSWN
jgi:glycerate-2-kinase/16S rRNA A1518/A1519 N6-dimethyltransferase RsmA/KsgA/DIM1 with predicted DNA glycosylase/AP lyase activity